MSMNTYPLEQKCALVIAPQVACAILLKKTFDDPDYGCDIPEPVLDALKNGRTPWECAADPAFKAILAENDWFCVSDAHDVLQSEDLDGTVYCSEFEGSAVPASDDGFGDEKSEEINYDDDFIAYLAPECQPALFHAPYADKEELLKEYEDKLSKFVGPGFPYSRYVMHVSGTYFC